MNLSLYGKIKLYETTKAELLDLWQNVLKKNNIEIKENSKVELIVSEDDIFKVTTINGDQYTCEKILLAIGRRGTPRKLNVPGETKEKVAYRLLEPELITGNDIIVVGGGDSAIESALLLADDNRVTLSYRNEVFNRIKPGNRDALDKAVRESKIDLRLNTNVTNIDDDHITLAIGKDGENIRLKNDLVYIFAGGELPTQFLEKAGIKITKKFGETVLKR